MLIDEIKNLHLQGEVLNDDAVLNEYSHDASFFEVRPQVVVDPQNAADIKKLVQFVSAAKDSEPGIAITPRSAGTDMSGGAIGESIILDVHKHINNFLEIGANYAVAEPGMFYRDFEKKTLEHNLLLPPYPASRELCALGGMVANNGAGEKTLTHGKIENYVEELQVVLSDGNEYTFNALDKAGLDKKMQQKDFEGELYRKVFKLIDDNYEVIKAAKPDVSKNSAGYYLWNVWDRDTGIFDMNKLLVGSQGTLGIVTKIKFRLIPPETNSKMMVIFLKDLSNLVPIVETTLRHSPETFESYDDYTLKLAMKFLPDLIKILKPKNMLRLAWQFIPEAKMVLTGGFPKLVLLAEFTGKTEQEAQAKLQSAYEDIKKFGVPVRMIPNEDEAKKYWVIRRESFNLLRHHIKDKRTAPFIDDIIVKPEVLPEFLPKLNKILQQYDLVYTIAGHIGNGNFHIIPLMNMKDPHNHEIIPKLLDEVFGLVLSYHGSITAEHNDGLIRSPYLRQMYGDKIYSLFEQTKKIFDPKNIFNPGKKVGATVDYAMSHIVKQ